MVHPVVLALAAATAAQHNASVARNDDAGSVTAGAERVRHGWMARAGVPKSAPPVLMPGWPLVVPKHPNFAPTRNVAFADLDGDARMELIRPSTDGRIYVFDHLGAALPGWPRSVGGWGQLPAAVADVDGDGVAEILVATRGLTSGGQLYVLRADGTDYPGWPKSLNNNNVESVVAADLDGDGRLEVIASERAYPIGYVHVFRADGTPFGGSWPAALDHVPALTPAVGDVDADGRPDVVMASYTTLYLFDDQGNVKNGWPYNVANALGARFSYQSPALGDLTGDGRLEIGVCLHQAGSGCLVMTAAGAPLAGWPKSFGGTWSYNPPTFADLDGDGRLDVLAGLSGGLSPAAAVWAWTAAGQALPGFPFAVEGGAESPLTVAQIDADPELEIFFGTSVMQNNQGFLHCIDARGNVEPGFPIRTDGFTYLNGATIGDVDGDGVLEIGVCAHRDSQVTIYLFKLTPGPAVPGVIAWKTYHEGNERRGLQAESDRLAVTGHATPGGTLQIELQGTAGNAMAAMLGVGTAVLPIPGWGILRLDPAQPIVPLVVAVLPASGRLWTPVAIPANNRLRGLSLPIQGVEAGAAGIALRQLQVARVR